MASDLRGQLQTTLGGTYIIGRELGGGGMSRVFVARDSALERDVVVKVLSPELAEGVSAKRFIREIKLVAALQDPHIVPLLSAGQMEDGLPYFMMPFVRGESLRQRMTQGKLPLAECISVLRDVIQALASAHRSGVVHRDIKPENVLLSEGGAVVTDFGIATALSASQTVPPSTGGARALTVAGTSMGTPAYMAPEQAVGDECDSRTDLYSWGMMSYELLTGAHPYAGKQSALQLMAAHIAETPPSLREPRFAMPPVLADIVMRCLEKEPQKRPGSTTDVLAALDTANRGENSGVALAPRAVTNLMIVPFRVLRSDPDTDFLAFSIPDAVGNALGGLQSLAVRSAAAGARYAGETLDLDRIAGEAEVNVVLTGTLVRAGNRIRVTTQLIETPTGTLVWSHAAQVSMQDLFQLQDEVVQGIVDSLSLSLTARERRLLKHDVPASAKAYEFYLRAIQASQAATAMESASWAVALGLYLECLDEDPNFAPAWARIGRIYRVIGKWGGADVEANQSKAEAAFKQALQLNPDLSIAHNLYAQLEVDLGRAEDAMLRLVARAEARGADPELFAGLVHACRFCGLLEASVAAHRHARRLDPGVATSVGQTYFMLGEYAQVIAEDSNATPNVRNLALAMLGREAEAIANFRILEAKLQTRYGHLLRCGRAVLEGRRQESVAAAEAVLASELKDPETLFYLARLLARVGEREQATSLIGRAVKYGFFCYPAIARDPWLDSLRAEPGFAAVLVDAETRYRSARNAFAESGGERMLGLAGAQPLATVPLP